MLAGILLDRQPTVKEVSKIIGCSDKKISELYPKKKQNQNDEWRWY